MVTYELPGILTVIMVTYELPGILTVIMVTYENVSTVTMECQQNAHSISLVNLLREECTGRGA